MLVLLFEVALAAIVPVSEVTFDVAVSGSIAEIEVRQTFRNDSPTRVDATYTFPLHNRAVVDGMKIRLEDRTIEGVILEKEEARKAFDEAVRQGKTAALTETQRWNLYQQEIGNIPPYAELEVILRIVQPVDRQGRTFELSLPVSEAGSFDGEPSRAPAADIAVEIDAGLPLKNVQCITHDAFEAPTGDGWTVLLNNVPPEQGPFVVRWELADDEAQIGSVYDEKHVLLLLEPPLAPAPDQLGRRDVLLLGDPQASGLAYTFGAFFPPGWTAHYEFTPDPGTALLQHLRAEEGYTDIVLLTDGAWPAAQIDAVIEAATVQDERLNLHVVGITPLANRYLLDELAERTGGVTSYAPWDQGGFVAAMGVPTFAALEFDWGDWGAVDLAAGVSDVGIQKPLQILARTQYTNGGPIEVTGTVGGERVTVRIDPRPVAHGRALGSSWARARIERLGRTQVRSGVSARDEGLPLALEYGILSPWTAFVAIDPRMHDAVAPPDAPAPAKTAEGGEGLREPMIEETDEEFGVDADSVADERFYEDERKESYKDSKRDAKPTLSRASKSAPPAPPRAMDPEPILEPEPEYAPAPMEEQSFGGASSNTNTYELDGANSTDRPASPSRVVQDRKLNSDAVPGYGRAGGSLSTKAAASKPRTTAEETYAADVSAVGRSFESTVQLVPGVVTRTRTAHPPRPTGAIGTQVSLGTENVVFTGGIDRTRVDGGHWTHVPAELAIRTQGVAIDAGYRYQRLTAPVQTATDRRRHAVDFATLFITNTVAVALDGLVQDLGCEGCDGTRAMAFGAGFRKRFESGPLRWSLGAGGAFSDFRGATPAQGDRTAIAVGPQFELSWVPRGFLGHLAVAGDVANPAGLQFVPTATGRLGPQLGQVWFGVGGGQRTDTRRPVRGVARVREAWAGVGAGFEPLDALLRFGWEEQQAPDAPQLEFLTELDDRRWTRRALVGQASLERSFGPVALGWTARYTHVLSTDADLNQPTAPYAAGLLLAHRPFWTGGTVALDRNRTSLQLDGGLASPVAARSWWAGWQAHAALGVHQGIRIRNSQLGFGVTGEVWSGRPGDPDPTRLDGWIAPDRAGTWAVRAGLTARY